MSSVYNFRKRLTRKRSISFVYPDDQPRYCICNELDDHTRYISCHKCEKWYHFRCSGILEVLPGVENGEIGSKSLRFFCGIDGCNQNKSIVISNGLSYLIKVQERELSTTKLSPDSNTTSGISKATNSESENCKGIDMCIERDTDCMLILNNNDDTNECKNTVTNGCNNNINTESISTSCSDNNNKTIKVNNKSDNESEFCNTELISSSEKPNNILHANVTIDTLSDLANTTFPSSGFFKKDIPPTSTHLFEKSIWDTLIQTSLKISGKTKSFRSGTWQKVFIDIIKKSNPFCSIMFTRHRVFIAEKRKPRNDVLFRADGYCKQTSCNVKNLKVVLHNTGEGLACIVHFNCNVVNHNVTVTTSRPIRGDERKKQGIFIGNQKPLKVYSEKISLIDKDVFVSGNRDGIGCSPTVLNQLKYESNSKDRLSASALDSLVLLKEKLLNEDKSESAVKGFVQFISVDPVIIFLWTRAAVKVFHDLCKHDAVFWDATGHLVKTSLTSKKLFYYELTVRNPTTGKISLPVSIMISSDLTQPTIQYWMSTFRNHEKMLYGSNRISQPHQINSDRALGFVISALQVFNGESLEGFLNRSWKVISGNATLPELKKTVVHTCAFHFMRNVKALSKKCFKNKENQKNIMWIMSLLMNCRTKNEIDHTLTSIITITSSKCVTSSVSKHLEILNTLLKDFRNNATKSLQKEMEDTYEKVNLQDKYIGSSEEEYHVLSTQSPFRDYYKKFCDYIKATVAKNDNCKANSNLKLNKMYSEDFSNQLLKWFLPTIPLWSDLLLGDLTRHSVSPVYKEYQMLCNKINKVQHSLHDSFLHSNRTTGVSEKRMGTLYTTLLGSKKVCRLDDFVNILKTAQDGFQRIFVDTLVRKNKPPNRTSRVVCEEWDKKRTKPKPVLSFQRGTGKDNTIILESKRDKDNSISVKTTKVPSKSVCTPEVNKHIETNVDLLPSKEFIQQLFNGIPHFYNNCWFNAVTVAVLHSYGAYRALPPLEISSDFVKHLLPIHASLGVCTSGKNINHELLKTVLVFVCEQQGFSFGTQQDASEYLLKVLSSSLLLPHDMNLFDDMYSFEEHRFTYCLNCSTKMTPNLTTSQSLQIPLSLTKPICSVQDVLNQYFEDEILTGDNLYNCFSCGKQSSAVIRTRLTKLPKLFTIVVKRFDSVSKIMQNITPNLELNLDQISNCKNSPIYSLRSIILHKGPNKDSEHYSTICNVEDNMIEIDDHLTNIVDWANPYCYEEVCRNGYVYTYENRAEIEIRNTEWNSFFILLYRVSSLIPTTNSCTKLHHTLNAIWNIFESSELLLLKHCTHLMRIVKDQLIRHVPFQAVDTGTNIFSQESLNRLRQLLDTSSQPFKEMTFLEENFCDKCKSTKRNIHIEPEVSVKSLPLDTFINRKIEFLSKISKKCCRSSCKCTSRLLQMPTFLQIVDQSSSSVNHTLKSSGGSYELIASIKDSSVIIFKDELMYTWDKNRLNLYDGEFGHTLLYVIKQLPINNNIKLLTDPEITIELRTDRNPNVEKISWFFLISIEDLIDKSETRVPSCFDRVLTGKDLSNDNIIEIIEAYLPCINKQSIVIAFDSFKDFNSAPMSQILEILSLKVDNINEFEVLLFRISNRFIVGNITLGKIFYINDHKFPLHMSEKLFDVMNILNLLNSGKTLLQMTLCIVKISLDEEILNSVSLISQVLRCILGGEQEMLGSVSENISITGFEIATGKMLSACLSDKIPIIERVLTKNFKFLPNVWNLPFQEEFECLCACENIPFNRPCKLTSLLDKIIGFDDDNNEEYKFVGLVKRILFWIMTNKEFVKHWCFLESRYQMTNYEKNQVYFLTKEKCTPSTKVTLCLEALHDFEDYLPRRVFELMLKSLRVVLTEQVISLDITSPRFKFITFPILHHSGFNEYDYIQIVLLRQCLLRLVEKDFIK